MAFTAVVPVTLNIAITRGLAQAFTSGVINSPAGSPVNLSAWTSLTAKLVPPTALPYGADTSFGTVTASSGGIVTLQTAAADLASNEFGTAKLVISGKPTSGDDPQVLCTGTLTLGTA